jgi:site-specific recombinase XerD
MKKEKYIRQSEHYLRIFIEITEHGVTKTKSKNITIANFKTPAKAMEYAKALRDQMLSDLRVGTCIDDDLTVGDLYARTRALFNCTLKTWNRHGIAYRHSIKRYENYPLAEIKASDIQASINDSINHYSNDATQRALAVWRQIYKAAVMLDMNIPDRTAAVTIPRDRKPAAVKKSVIISEDDYLEYIGYLKMTAKYTKDKVGKYRKTRIIDMIEILHDTGMRPSEVMALDRSDIDLNAGIIHVTKRVGSTADEKRQIVATKTLQSIRDVPISDYLRPILIEALVSIKGEHLFWDMDDKPMEINFLSAYVSRTSKDAGVRFNLYMLRHNMATDLIQSGTSARTTQDILGHASYKQSVAYARSSEDDRKKAIENRRQN